MIKVSRIEQLNNLRTSIKKNEDCLDDLKNWINRVRDRLKYDENDLEAKDALESLEYLQFCMMYLDTQYKKAYKGLGGKL